ncbi:MAG: hypothetical protein GTN62_00860 [Gemmatimonadales bacterium]|nr:hypothetical protein [Gemmatimonadales bacterium]NIN48653.1 hypothetical protein [Gemmatimonadales bacterium]NIP06117.1 hypothetical protein [Gemmatimonadales bacterium]NIR01291.1 hypothetical protein [Gemmatimonadales bacterium]
MIRVVVDDIAFVPADAVVRPTTDSLEPVSPALRRLEQVGGPAFWKQLDPDQSLDIGAAVVTGAGDLAPEFVIHAVIRTRDEPVSATGVRRALTSVLQRAVDWQLERLSVPLVGTGVGNLSAEDAARILVDVLVTDLERVTYPREVCIVVETEEDRAFVEACIQSRTS